jgi:cytoskeleton protein RodZ
MEHALNDAGALPLGQILRQTREHMGFSIEAVAKKLCINKRQIEKLESEQEDLTCDVYTLGFLRSYAQFLNLNAGELIQQLRDKTTNIPLPHLDFPVPLPERGKPSCRVLYFSLFLLVAVILGYEWLEKLQDSFFSQREFVAVEPSTSLEHKISESVPPQVVEPVSQVVESLPADNGISTVTPIDNPPSPVIPAVAQSPAPATESSPVSPTPEVPLLAGQSVLLQAKEQTWIEVKNEKGEIVLSRLFSPNETFEFQSPQNLVLKTGNAGGVQLSSGDKSLSFPERRGEVIVGIPLDSLKWEGYQPPERETE